MKLFYQRFASYFHAIEHLSLFLLFLFTACALSKMLLHIALDNLLIANRTLDLPKFLSVLIDLWVVDLLKPVRVYFHRLD
jgi:hypothetical protein